MPSYSKFERYIKTAKEIRKKALLVHYNSKTSHIASGFSCIEILVYLYGGWLNISPEKISDPNRDRFILSKGHAAATYYIVLSHFGFFPEDWLSSYCKYGGKLGGHISHKIPGVEVSTGSLGHGLPISVGMALGAKIEKKNYKVVVLMSDGELNSGSNWEAILFANSKKLDNLLIIVDRNKMQAMGYTEEIIPLENLNDKFLSFGCAVKRINGHEFAEIEEALNSFPFQIAKPSVVIADTIKGKGVSFMENNIQWHYKSPNELELKKALEEITRK